MRQPTAIELTSQDIEEFTAALPRNSSTEFDDTDEDLDTEQQLIARRIKHKQVVRDRIGLRSEMKDFE